MGIRSRAQSGQGSSSDKVFWEMAARMLGPFMSVTTHIIDRKQSDPPPVKHGETHRQRRLVLPGRESGKFAGNPRVRLIQAS